jgi:uncharacterized repeat protein (TIGR04052 family)
MRGLVVLLVAGCAGQTEVDVRFGASLGDEPFACGTDLSPVGSTGLSASPRDLRFYVHDVTFLDEAGAALPTTTAKNPWQHDGVVLVDLEDGSGDCETLSTDVHDYASVSVEGQPAGLRFVLGVPPELNHLDAAVATSPLNVPKLFWSWAMGYKYFVAELRTPQREEILFHIGATGCMEAEDGFSCAQDNLVTVELPQFDPAVDVVDVALDALWGDLDLSGTTEEDSIPGCMSFPEDPECVPVFEAFGLPYGGVVAAEQRVFVRRP